MAGGYEIARFNSANSNAQGGHTLRHNSFILMGDFAVIGFAVALLQSAHDSVLKTSIG